MLNCPQIKFEKDESKMGLGKYVDLSQLAKKAGGPEKCIRIIKSHKAILGTAVALVPFAVHGAVDLSQKSYKKMKELKYKKETEQ